MMTSRLWIVVAVALVATVSCSSPTPEPAEEPAEKAAAEPTPEETIAQVEAMCASAKDAIEARHAADPLYNRLGGRDGIHAAVDATVQLHLQNAEISHMFETVDIPNLVNHATDFIAAGSGGSEEYHGRDMVSVHEPLGLTNADFLAASADLTRAMTDMDVGADEQQEVTCMFFSLREVVVTQ